MDPFGEGCVGLYDAFAVYCELLTIWKPRLETMIGLQRSTFNFNNPKP